MKETLLNNPKQPARVPPGRHVYKSVGEQVMVDGHQLDPCLDIEHLCSACFGWGRYKGLGSYQLSLAILVTEFGPYPKDHPVNYQEFRDAVIVTLPNSEDWALTSWAIYQACRGILLNNADRRANESAYWKKGYSGMVCSRLGTIAKELTRQGYTLPGLLGGVPDSAASQDSQTKARAKKRGLY